LQRWGLEDGASSPVPERIKTERLLALGANRVQICCDARNLRSRRVAERAGYRLDAEFANDMVAPDGALRTTVVYVMLPRAEPEAR